jgi:hypothetical protein
LTHEMIVGILTGSASTAAAITPQPFCMVPRGMSGPFSISGEN